MLSQVNQKYNVPSDLTWKREENHFSGKQMVSAWLSDN
jgi:hypothetical protein